MLQKERSAGVPVLVFVTTKVLILSMPDVYVMALMRSAEVCYEGGRGMLASFGKPQLCMKALPLFFLHVGQWQRYRSSGSEAMVNCTVLQRQEPVVGKLDEGIAVES